MICSLCGSNRESATLRRYGAKRVPCVVCVECAGGLSLCECGALIREGVEQGDATMCKKCWDDKYYNCSSCRNIFTKSDDPLTMVNDAPMCPTCVAANSFECIGCGRSAHVTERHGRSRFRNYCRYCDPPMRPSGVRQWDYRPEFAFVCSPKEAKSTRTNMQVSCEPEQSLLYLGIELELDNWRNKNEPDDMWESMRKNSGLLWYGKHDGSLGANGWELVTMPCTLESHKAVDWRLICREAKENYRPNAGCGLHVHMNRTFFGLDAHTHENKVVEMKIASFIYSTSHLWEHIAGRCGNPEYARLTDIDRPSDVLRRLRSKPDTRYSAINFSNSDTIELRFMKSTTNYEDLMARLEFVDAIARFVKESQLALLCRGNKAWEQFVKYVGNNKERYENLSVQL